MEPNLWRRGVMEELLPPLTLGKQEQANPKSEIYSPSPHNWLFSKVRMWLEMPCGHPGARSQGTLSSQVGDALLPRDPVVTTGCLPIPEVCSCLGTAPSLPALCEGQGTDTSDDLTVSFYYFYFHFSMTIFILLSFVFSSSRKDSFYVAG